MSNKTKIIIGIVVVVLLAVLSSYKTSPTAKLGSIQDGMAYNGVVTGLGQQTSGLIKLGGGTLGSVVVTTAGAGSFVLYDATTTNVNLRAGATTTLRQLAAFPGSATVGTYTFDTAYSMGLIVEFTGTQGTTTLTYR